jgi:glutamate---cysteine ligase / carboxylate-amine ligase
MLLDAADWSLAPAVEEVLASLPPELSACASAETHACVVELRTAPHSTVGAAQADLVSLRCALAHTVAPRLGLRVAAAGTHPLALGSEVRVSSTDRYRQIAAAMRALTRREPTMALHVHVAVPDGAAAIRALNGLRAELPLMLALSANSPFWRGEDSGFDSMRAPLFSVFPRVRIPGHFRSYEHYVRTIDPLVRSGAVPDPSHLWWDARPRPWLGTVEVRIMDAQSRSSDSAALAAVVQCLVRRHAGAAARGVIAAELLEENRFVAARDGMRARLIDPATHRPRPVVELVRRMLAACEPHATRLGCERELGAVEALAADSGADRQRRRATQDGPAALPRWLAREFVVACPHAPHEPDGLLAEVAGGA